MKSSKLLKYNKRKGFSTKKRNQRGGTPEKLSVSSLKINISGMGGESAVEVKTIPTDEINKYLTDIHKNNKLFTNQREDFFKLKDLVKLYDDDLDLNDLINNTYLNLDHTNWDVNTTELHLVDYHGKSEEYKDNEESKCIVPDNTIIVFLTPINNIGYIGFQNLFDTMIKNKKIFENIVNRRAFLSYVDEINFSDNYYKQFIHDCFSFSTWYYPGQKYPNTYLSREVNEVLYRYKNVIDSTITDKIKLTDTEISMYELLSNINKESINKKIIFFPSCRVFYNNNFDFVNKLFKKEYLIRNLNISIEKKFNNNKKDLYYNNCSHSDSYYYYSIEKNKSKIYSSDALSNKRNENYNVVTPFLKIIYDYINNHTGVDIKVIKKYALFLSNISFNKQMLFLLQLYTLKEKNNYTIFFNEYRNLYKKKGYARKKYEEEFKNFVGQKKLIKYISFEEYGKIYFLRYSFLLEMLNIKTDIKAFTTSGLDYINYSDLEKISHIFSKNKKKLELPKIMIEEINLLNLKLKLRTDKLNIDSIPELCIDCKSKPIKIDMPIFVNIDICEVKNCSEINITIITKINKLILKNCVFNKYALINFSKNLNLKDIVFINCKINTGGDIKVLFNENLNSLSLENTELTPTDDKFYKNLNEFSVISCIKPVYISKLHNIKSLFIKNNKIDHNNFQQYLIELSNLKYLHLENINFEIDNVELIGDGIGNIFSKRLKHLDYVYLKNIPKLSIKNMPRVFINNFFSNRINLISNIGNIKINTIFRTEFNEKNNEKQITGNIEFI